MPSQFALGAVLGLLCFGSLTAQTYIVDVNVGPGHHFQQIRGALSQVPDGATLIVRAGDYAQFSITNRSINIFCEPGVKVAVPYPLGVPIRDVAAGQRVVIRGLQVLESHSVFDVQNCAGEVLLENIAHSPPSAGPGIGNQVALVYRSDQVVIRNCNFGGALSIVDSEAVVEGCVIRGSDARDHFGQLTPALPGIMSLNSTGYPGVLRVVDCDVRGGAALQHMPGSAPAPALSLSYGTGHLLGDTILTAGDPNGHAPAAAIGGLYGHANPSVLRMDPSVTLVTTASPAIHPAVQTTATPLLHVTSQSANLGGSITAEAHGPDGTLVILVVGLPGPPIAFPGIDGDFWLDPTISAWAALGTIQQGAPIPGSATIPNDPGFRGLIIGWQSLGTLNGFTTSNPSWALVY
ncbi:MAG: hypothetical protein NXI31_17560 [bacterium]|nr:hypothetical protein [bacterium]